MIVLYIFKFNFNSLRLYFNHIFKLTYLIIQYLVGKTFKSFIITSRHSCKLAACRYLRSYFALFKSFATTAALRFWVMQAVLKILL